MTSAVNVRHMKKAFFAVTVMVAFAVTWGAGSVSAVPSLQLYMKGASYDSSTESWLTTENPFELQVLGAITPKWIHYTSHLTLFVAVPDGYWDPSAEVAITPLPVSEADNESFFDPPSPGDVSKDEDPPNPSFSSLTLNTSTPMGPGDGPRQWYGHPNDTGLYGGVFPPHGVYNPGVPVHFWTVPLPLLQVDSAGETVYDYNDNFTDVNGDGIPDDPDELGSGSGDIHYFEISYSPFTPAFLLHFDVVGLAHNGGSLWQFAPFSHDADAQAIPEPATVLLLGLGLLSVAGIRAGRQTVR